MLSSIFANLNTNLFPEVVICSSGPSYAFDNACVGMLRLHINNTLSSFPIYSS